jgi:hypothetical protein
MFVSLSVKIQGDSYSFDIAESEYVNKISLSPTKGNLGNILMEPFAMFIGDGSHVSKNKPK